MECNIKVEKQRKLRRVIAKDIMEMVDQGQPFALNKYVNSIYTLIENKTGDYAMALDYARLTPFFINQILSSDLNLLEGMRKAGLDRNALDDLLMQIKDPKTGMEIIGDYLNLQADIIQELKTLNQGVEKMSSEEAEQPVENKSVPTSRSKAKVITLKGLAGARTLFPKTMFADVSFETEKEDIKTRIPSDNPETQFQFKVKRNLLRLISENNYDSSELNLDEYGSVYLQAIASTEVPDNILSEGLDLSQEEVREAHETGVVLMVVGENNEPVLFDPDGLPAKEGRGVYFYMRRTEDWIDENGDVSFKKGTYPRLIADSLAEQIAVNSKKVTQKEYSTAQANISREVDMINDIRNFINADKSRKVRMKIIGGTMGNIPYDYNIKTPINKIDFGNQPFDPRFATDAEIAAGEKKSGVLYIEPETMYGAPVELERPAVKDTPFTETLVNLFTEKMVYEDSLGFEHEMDIARRREIIDKYFHTSDNTLQISETKDGDLSITIVGEHFVLSDENIKAKLQNKLQTYFTRLIPSREISKGQIRGRKITRQKDPSKYKLNQILEVPQKTGPSKYYVIEYPKIAPSSAKEIEIFTDFQPREDGRVLVTFEKQPYKEVVLKEHFYINYALNAENKLVRLDAYLTFEPLQEDLGEVYSNVKEEVITEAQENPLEDTSSLTGESSVDNTEDPDEVIRRIIEDSELQKQLGVKAEELKATQEQIKVAKKWYENHPMSDHFGFKELFHLVNTKTPTAAATWTVNGITLYKGADYSDLYHEAWHGFSQGFLSKKDKTALYNETRKKKGSFKDYSGKRVSFKNATDLQIEEFLAEDFRKYMLSGQKSKKNTPKRNTIFRKIYNFLKALFEGVSLNQVVADDKANKVIRDLYKKLRIGNIGEFTFSQDNVMFGGLNTGIQPYTESEQTSLLYEDSMLLVETIDSLISELVDRRNAFVNDKTSLRIAKLEQELQEGNLSKKEENDLKAELDSFKQKATYGYTLRQLKTAKGRLEAYQYTKARLAQLHQQLKTAYENATDPTEKARLKKNVELLQYALDNFGDTENIGANRPDPTTGEIKGVIGYHISKSRILDREDVKVIFQQTDENESKQIKGRTGYERGGNESSMRDLAKPEILNILHTLHKYDENGKPVYNKLGVHKVTPFREVWNRLARTLAGLSAEEMEQALLKEKVDYPPFEQLLGKLGPLETGSLIEADLWTSFWRTFNLTKIPLIQMTVDRVIGENGLRYDSHIGEATGEYRKIGRMWESAFRTNDTSKYIQKNNFGERYLDIDKVLADFPKNTLGDKQWEFFNAIGFALSDKKEIRTALKNQDIGGAFYYRERLEYLNSRGDILVTSLDDLNREFDPIEIDGKRFRQQSDQNTRYNQLQKLEIRYSDMFSNFMVSNAAGNPQSEYSLNSTLSGMVGGINSAKDYQSLVSQPEYSHLSVERNPFAASSKLLNSVFVLDVDPNNVEYGTKRRTSDKKNAPFINLELNNLSGVLLQHGGATVSEGIESAKADPNTKLIYDIHLMLQHAMPELMRHADKSTSYSVVANRIFTGGKLQNLYVQTKDFETILGHERALDILLPYINAELKRIRMMENAGEYGMDVNYDQNYVAKGKAFVMFDKMLSEDTKKMILDNAGENLTDYLKTRTPQTKELLRSISSDVLNYFNTSLESLSTRYRENPFIAENLQENLNVSEDTMLKSLLYNTWIHNFETVALFYGDVALYDDMHKRIAGIGSTGLLARTDNAMRKLINTTVTRDYANNLGVEPKAYNGIFSTGVIQDKITSSAYLNEFKEVLGNTAGNEYGEIEETDAMGLIQFDSYRILKVAQGQWLPEHEKMYQNIVNGKKVNSREIRDVFFPTMKAQYYGPLADDRLPVTAFHKFELYPLIPDVIENSPRLKELHNKMVREGVDYITFGTGSKVGTFTKSGELDNVYTKDRIITDTPFTKNDIFVKYLKDQLEIGAKFKGIVTFPTQLRTLIESGLYKDGKPIFKGAAKLVRQFENNVTRLTEHLKKELLQKAHYKLNEDGSIDGNFEDLVEFLKREMQRLDMGDHEIDFLEIKDGELKTDASMALFADKLERAIQAIVAKQLINQKVTGEALVQVSGAMWEAAQSTNRDYTNPTDEERAKWGSNDLPFYHKGEDGKTRPMKVKIALQGEFKKLLGLKHADGKRIGSITRLNEMLKDEVWLNLGEHRRMITMTGVRIPVQGLNSMEFMEIYEFLPEKAGNIIVLPSEIVKKSGSDYDIDKLTILMPSFTRTSKSVKLTETYELQKGETQEDLRKQRAEVADRVRVLEKQFDEIFKDRKVGEFNKLPAQTQQIFENRYEQFIDVRDEILDEIRVLQKALRKEKERPVQLEIVQQLDKLYNELNIEREEWFNFSTEYISDLKEVYATPVNDQLDELTIKVSGLSAKPIENDLLWSIKSILEVPENYENLIRPNTTTDAEALADQIAKDLHGRNPDATVSGTDLLSYEYNLNKHHSMNAGKKTVSLAAVGNKWNPLFNRVGAYLNPSAGITNARYKKLSDKKKLSKEERRELRSYRRQTLLLKHHTVDTPDGKGISLAKLMDADNRHRISNMIDQLLNGTLDVAKKEWIFDVSWNEQTAPIIEFMLEAGVPFEDAIKLVSLPIVQDYIKEQQLYGSTLAEAIGRKTSIPMVRRSAQAAIINDSKYGFDLEVTPKDVGWKAYNESVELTSNINEFDPGKLYSIAKKHYAAIKEGKTPTYTEYQRAAFLHYLEIEAMAAAMRDVKLRLNVDTTKSMSLFEIQQKQMLAYDLLQDSRWPKDIIERIINNSPISSFFIQDFQLAFTGDKIFKLRNHKVLNKFLQFEVSDDAVNTTFGKKETFAAEFRNDLTNYIFQNSAGAFNIDKLESYRGLTIEKDVKVETVSGLKFGAFVKDDILYIDKETLSEAYSSGELITEVMEELGLAQIDSSAFKTSKEYYRFTIEREYLRYLHPFAEIKTSPEFQHISELYTDEFSKLVDETNAEYTARRDKGLYELYLRDKALTNTNNVWHLFQSENTYAKEFSRLRKTYPFLEEDYRIVNQLSVISAGGYTNLRINDTKLDGDMINLYHENLQRLADPQVIKTPDRAVNDYISSFFDRFAQVAFLQSGQNTKSVFSMVRVVPQQKITRLITRASKEYKKHFDVALTKNQTPAILMDFYNKFVNQNTDRSKRIRSKNYSSEMTLQRSIDMLKTDKTLLKERVVDSPTPLSDKATEVAIPEMKKVAPVSDQMVRDYMNNCLK